MALSCTEGGNRGKLSSSPACRSLLPLHFLHAMCSKGPGPGVHWVTFPTLLLLLVSRLNQKSPTKASLLVTVFFFFSQIFFFSPLTCSDLLSILKLLSQVSPKPHLEQGVFDPLTSTFSFLWLWVFSKENNGLFYSLSLLGFLVLIKHIYSFTSDSQQQWPNLDFTLVV